jgi:phosphoglycerol transferase
MTRFWNWRNPAVILVALSALALGWLLQRQLGLNPAVFADEWYYSKMSRLAALRDAILPSYLYLWLFRFSSACGDRFLDCAKVGNVLFYIGATPFVYLAARAFTPARLALLVAALALAAPMNLYTDFFMPEAMYYFGFCVLGWMALTRTGWSAMVRALACGALLGLLSLVKVHALFLLPALCLFLFYEHWSRRAAGPWLQGGLLAMAWTVAAAAAVKFALGYLFAGPAGLGLFGSLYGDSAATSSQRPLPMLAAFALTNAGGHLMALAVLLALPLAMLVQRLASPEARSTDAPAAAPAVARLHVYTALMLVAALGMTVLYTASIAQPGNGQELRLHLRYYSFVFPLLWTVCAAWLSAPPAPTQPLLRGVLALLLAAALVFALMRLPSFTRSIIDGPDLISLDMRRERGLVVCALELIALVLWLRNSPAAPRLYLFLLLPLTLVLAQRTEQLYLRQLIPNPGFFADAAGEAGRHAIPRAEMAQTTVAATNEFDLFRVLFHLDAQEPQLLNLKAGAPIEPGQVSPASKWLLVVGPHAYPSTFEPFVTGKDYVLTRVRPLLASGKLGGELPDGMVAAVQGLSDPEGWGRWSVGPRVVIHLTQPLPRDATVVLTGSAFGPNATQPFLLRAGGDSAPFRLGPAPQQTTVHLATDGQAHELVIEVPQPVSPRALGLSNDERPLGIGLARIDLLASEPAVPPAQHALATH